jgi:hypothetical protein
MGRRHSKYPQREIAILRFFETFSTDTFFAAVPFRLLPEHHQHTD